MWYKFSRDRCSGNIYVLCYCHQIFYTRDAFYMFEGIIDLVNLEIGAGLWLNSGVAGINSIYGHTGITGGGWGVATKS